MGKGLGLRLGLDLCRSNPNPQISAETNSRLDRPLQLGELHAAQKSMQDWTILQNIVAHDMLDICNKSLVSGSLPFYCRRAVTTLLPKKGNLHEIKNWHPMSGLQDSVPVFGQQAERSYEAMAKIPLCFYRR